MSKELIDKMVGGLTGMLKTAFHRGYMKGLKDGVHAYSWMKDGVYYVGSCGTTLKEAYTRIDKEENSYRWMADEGVKTLESEVCSCTPDQMVPGCGLHGAFFARGTKDALP